MKKVRVVSCDIPPLPKVIALHAMHATNIIFTLPALGPMVMDGFKSQLALKTVSDAFFWEMVSLLGSIMVLPLLVTMMAKLLLLHMRMVLRCMETSHMHQT